MNQQLRFYDIKELQPQQEAPYRKLEIVAIITNKQGRVWVDKANAIFSGGGQLVGFVISLAYEPITISYPARLEEWLCVIGWAAWPEIPERFKGE